MYSVQKFGLKQRNPFSVQDIQTFEYDCMQL